MDMGTRDLGLQMALMEAGGQRPATPERLVLWGKDDKPVLLASVPELREGVAKWQVFLFRYPETKTKIMCSYQISQHGSESSCPQHRPSLSLDLSVDRMPAWSYGAPPRSPGPSAICKGVVRLFLNRENKCLLPPGGALTEQRNYYTQV